MYTTQEGEKDDDDQEGEGEKEDEGMNRAHTLFMVFSFHRSEFNGINENAFNTVH